MFKAMILLKRKDGSTREEFASWWLKQHRPLAEQLPGVRRAIFNLATQDTADTYDGISELWFDTEAGFEAAYASEVGLRVAEDSLNNVGDRLRLFVTEHVIKS